MYSPKFHQESARTKTQVEMELRKAKKDIELNTQKLEELLNRDPKYGKDIEQRKNAKSFLTGRRLSITSLIRNLQQELDQFAEECSSEAPHV